MGVGMVVLLALRTAVLSSALLAVGCTIPPPVTAEQQLRAEIYRDDLLCRSYGLNFGTQPYASCRMQLGQQRRFSVHRASLFGGSY